MVSALLLPIIGLPLTVILAAIGVLNLAATPALGIAFLMLAF
jgi:hypothetical protein